MTRNDIVRALNEEYDRLRADNQRERDRRIGEVIAKDPSMEALIYGGRDLFRKQARLLLSIPSRPKKTRGRRVCWPPRTTGSSESA